jgi:hypothetical protein
MFAFSGDETKEYLVGKLRDLQTVLTTSPQVGRQILQKQIRKITLTPGEAGSKRVFHVAVEFSYGDGGNSGVMLHGTLEAFLQQYGFTTITIDGLALDSSRVRRRPVAVTPQSGNDNDSGASSSSRAAAPSTQACDSDSTAIVA